MDFPVPDQGIVALPGPDRADAVLPSSQGVAVRFPPAPIPVRDAATSMDGVASAVLVVVPVRSAAVSMNGVATAAVLPCALVSAAVSMDSQARADRSIDAAASMNSAAAAVMSPVTAVAAAAVMDGGAGIVGEAAVTVFATVVASMDASAGIAIEGFAAAPVLMDANASAAVTIPPRYPSPGLFPATTMYPEEE